MPRYITPAQLTSAPGRPGRWPTSLSTAWRQVREGLLTTLVELGPKARAWPIEEIEAIEAAINAGQTNDERRALVQQLLAARVDKAAAAKAEVSKRAAPAGKPQRRPKLASTTAGVAA